MILSHKYKYIFIKSFKTASTSLEIALSKYFYIVIITGHVTINSPILSVLNISISVGIKK